MIDHLLLHQRLKLAVACALMDFLMIDDPLLYQQWLVH